MISGTRLQLACWLACFPERDLWINTDTISLYLQAGSLKKKMKASLATALDRTEVHAFLIR
jgi:hypothetical protein